MKKLFAIFLAVMMIAALAVPAFAAETVTVTVTEPTDKAAATTPETYTAYKLLSATKTAELAADGPIDEDDSGITYYTDAATADLLGSYFTFADGKVGEADVKVVTESSIYAEDQTSAAGLLAIAKTNSFASSSVTVGEATTLDIGYYVIESSLGTQLILLTTDQTIAQKNYYPSFTKALTNIDDKNAAIGDTIEYTITVTVPYTVSEAVVIHDTLDAGLSYVSTSFSPSNSAVTATDDGQTITFNVPASVADTAGKQNVTITINYSAVVTSAARSGNIYKNTAYLTYSKFQSEDQKTETNTNKLTVSKLEGDTSNFLPGAILQLQNAAGNAVKLVADGSNYRLATTEEITAAAADDFDPEAEGAVVVVDSFTTGSAAIVIEGIDSDLAYKVAELEAPAGYNALTTATDVAANPGNDSTATVRNYTGTVLPSTGGIGTTIFYVIGGILVVGAGILLITKKRMGKEDV